MRGRPPKSTIPTLKTKVWAHFLRENAFKDIGLVPDDLRKKFADKIARGDTDATGYALSKIIHKSTDYARNYNRYLSGERESQRRGNWSPVDDAEKVYPGSSRIFYSPMWDILDGQWPTVERIERELELFKDSASEIIRPEESVPIPIGEDVFEMLENYNKRISRYMSWDCLEAIVLMLGIFEKIGRSDMWNPLCRLYRYMAPHYAASELIPFADEILDAIDIVATQRLFLTRTQRLDFYRCSRGISSWPEDEHEVIAALTKIGEVTDTVRDTNSDGGTSRTTDEE